MNASGVRSASAPPVTGVNTNFFSAPEKLDNAGVWNAVKAAEIPALRFPGGTRASGYDWVTGNIRPGGNVSREDARQSTRVPIDDFMGRARSAGASVSYVINITDSPASLKRLAHHWKATNAPVRWVEMGNEYYLPDLINTIGGPAGYLRRAQRALEALRAGGYKGPAGLVVAPVGVLGGSDPHGEFHSWNRALAGSDTSGFDATILHYYPRPQEVGFQKVYEEGPSNLTTVIEGLKKQFPGKQLWVTEWNLGKPPNSPKFNTLWHALFDLRMMKAMLEAGVNLACYHVLTGQGYELLGPSRYRDGLGGGLSRRVPYFAFQMVDEAKSGGAKYIPGPASARGIEYMAFRTRKELRVVAWSAARGTSNVEIRTGKLSPKLLGGKVLHSHLYATNGSTLRMKSMKAAHGEKVKPEPISSPRLKGAGAVLLRFSLRNSSG